MTPLITVLIPVLNGADYLAEAIDSLMAQTCQDFNILVLDGGSTDRTPEIARSYNRVQLISCGRVGLGAQLRIGLYRTASPLVARMDADDISLPHRFAAQIRALDDPDLAIVGGQIGLRIGSAVHAGQPFPESHETIRRLLMTGFPSLCHSAVMFRTRAAQRVRAYSIRGLGEDLDLFLRMTEAGKAYNLDDVILQVRIHESSVCFTSLDEIRKNYTYAVECAAARSMGAEEPTAEEFDVLWSGRNRLAILGTRIECAAVRLYRKSRARLASTDRIRGAVGVIVSVVLRPRLIRARILIWLAKAKPQYAHNPANSRRHVPNGNEHV